LKSIQNKSATNKIGTKPIPIRDKRYPGREIVTILLTKLWWCEIMHWWSLNCVLWHTICWL